MKKGLNAADKVLLLAFAVFLLALYLHFNFRGNLWAAAFLFVAEASLVGGIADWFAVTALFSRPLGFPWHTAILPAHRAEFADATVKLIEREFLSRRKLFGRLKGGDWRGDLLAKLFDDEVREQLEAGLTRIIGQFLASLDLKFAEQAISEAVRRRLWAIKASEAVGAVRAAVAGRYQRDIRRALAAYIADVANAPDFVSRTAAQLRSGVETKETRPFMAMLKGFAELVNIVNYDEAAELICCRLLLVSEAVDDENSPIAKNLTAELLSALDRLAEDEEFAATFNRESDQIIANLPIEAAVRSAFAGFSASLGEFNLLAQGAGGGEKLPAVWETSSLDTNLPVKAGDIAAVVKRIASPFVSRFLENLAAGEATGKLLYDAAGRSVLKARQMAGEIARAAIDKLSDDDLNALVYDKVEPDLLWIRMNGSIVGAIVGLALFVVLELIPRFMNG